MVSVATRERWRAQVEAWAASGETCRAYAAQAGVNPRTLAWWKSRLKSEAKVERRATFVEVTDAVTGTWSDEDAAIELQIAGVEIRLRGRVDPEALQSVLDVLEERR